METQNFDCRDATLMKIIEVIDGQIRELKQPLSEPKVSWIEVN